MNRRLRHLFRLVQGRTVSTGGVSCRPERTVQGGRSLAPMRFKSSRLGQVVSIVPGRSIRPGNIGPTHRGATKTGQRPGPTRWLLTLALFAAATCNAATNALPQHLHLGQPTRYDFLAYANADLNAATSPATRAVVLVHGVRRNADDYFAIGQRLLQRAGLAGPQTLLLAPNFLTATDRRAGPDLPLWPKDQWMHGGASSDGVRGIDAFAVLDDVLGYLADRRRFPALRDIVLIGHSAGGQLMQRYSLLGEGDQRLAGSGIRLRYGVSSPSSYVYLDNRRLQADAFTPVAAAACPDYNRYRYGLEHAPEYLARQHLTPAQLFRRYASRDVLFMVGGRDDDPRHRVLDRGCAAELQGAQRLERQRTYLHYEAFLAHQWQIPIDHRQITVEGVGHNAARLFTAQPVVDALLTQ